MLSQPNYYAFFDVDGTVLNTKTMPRFLKYFYFKKSKQYVFKLYQLKVALLEVCGISREYLNRDYYQHFKGIKEEDLKHISLEWSYIEEENFLKLINKEVIHALNHHKKQGAMIVFVSGSFHFCLKILAEKLGVDHILATTQELIDGKYTGKILFPQTIGNGKALAINKFLEERCFTDLHKCYAYGDHCSDFAMLNLVGNPVVVPGDKNLERIAREKGWMILKKLVR